MLPHPTNSKPDLLGVTPENVPLSSLFDTAPLEPLLKHSNVDV
jgi:hypothetical protein